MRRMRPDWMALLRSSHHLLRWECGINTGKCRREASERKLLTYETHPTDVIAELARHEQEGEKGAERGGGVGEHGAVDEADCA